MIVNCCLAECKPDFITCWVRLLACESGWVMLLQVDEQLSCALILSCVHLLQLRFQCLQTDKADKRIFNQVKKARTPSELHAAIDKNWDNSEARHKQNWHLTKCKLYCNAKSADCPAGSFACRQQVCMMQANMSHVIQQVHDACSMALQSQQDNVCRL